MSNEITEILSNEFGSHLVTLLNFQANIHYGKSFMKLMLESPKEFFEFICEVVKGAFAVELFLSVLAKGLGVNEREAFVKELWESMISDDKEKYKMLISGYLKKKEGR
ncbi:MAG: hypothetical protein N3D12_05880 [Candidatus Methanomethyliaceae archaeon]|nr:hypothetical protein [Candidatus Methanomethyliaceae archaeon]